MKEDFASGYNNYRNWAISPGIDQTTGYAQLTSYHEYEHAIINSTTIYGNILRSYAVLSKHFDEGFIFKNIHEFLEGKSKTAHECGATWTSIERSLHNNPHLLLHDILDSYKEYKPYFSIAETMVKEIKGTLYRRMVISTCIIISFHGYRVCKAILDNFINPEFEGLGKLDFPNDRFLHIAKHFSSTKFASLCENFISERKGHPHYIFLKEEFEGLTPLLDATVFKEIFLEFSSYLFDVLQEHFDVLESPSYKFDDGSAFFEELTEKMMQHVLKDEENSSDIKAEITELKKHFNKSDRVERSIGLKYESEITILSELQHFATILWPSQIGELKSQVLEGDDFRRINIMFRNSATMRGVYYFLDKEHKEWFEKENRVLTFIRKRYEYEDSPLIVIIPFETPEQLSDFISEKSEVTKIICNVSHSSIGLYENEWKSFIAGSCDYIYYLNDWSLIQILDDFQIDENTVVKYTSIIIEYAEKKAIVLVFHFENKIIGWEEIHFVPCSHGFADYFIGYIGIYHPQYEYDDSFLNVDIYMNIQSSLRSIYREESSWYFRAYSELY